jgi:hypothetical protein
MQGTLAQISLNDILLLITGGKKSGTLKLSRGKETVDIYVAEGNIVHATCPIGDGEKALLYPVTWTEGIFALVSNGTPPSQTINKSSAELLAEVKAMSQEWERILQVIPTSKTVFRIADPGEEGNGAITVPHTGWRVLSKIDGYRDVQSIAEVLRLPYAYTAKVLYNLHQAGLVETLSTSAKASVVDTVPPGFFDRMIDRLTECVGPMAFMIIHDQIAVLGESPAAFPQTRLEELIELVSREISDNKLKAPFQQQMSDEIRTFKLF